MIMYSLSTCEEEEQHPKKRQIAVVPRHVFIPTRPSLGLMLDWMMSFCTAEAPVRKRSSTESGGK